MVTIASARKLERMQIEDILVRSPRTCEASLGLCRRCYGMDFSTGQLVEPGTLLTMRTLYTGGAATRGVQEKDFKAKRDGKVKYVGISPIVNDAGQRIALSRNGDIHILDPEGRELEKYDIPDGAEMKVEDGQVITRGTMICERDPHDVPILSEVGGRVRDEDIVEGETMRIEIDPSGHTRRAIMEHNGDLHLTSSAGAASIPGRAQGDPPPPGVL